MSPMRGLVLCPVCEVRLKSASAKTCMTCRPQTRRPASALDRTLAAARRAGLEGRDLVLATMSEATWTEHVVGWALRGSWCGVHLRQSHVVGSRRRGERPGRTGFAALRGIHDSQHHEHNDASGIPDWYFWRAPRGYVGESFHAELKIWGEKPRPDQERVIDALRAAGHEVFVWNPVDHGVEARERFMRAPRPAA